MTPAEEDAHWMRRCLHLARRAEGRTAPNPMVGSVIVRQGQVLAEGWHEAPGRPHAEPAALARLEGPPEGATLYVNLEPCCTWGRTPPCTDALLAARIQRVVIGMVDPHPQVNGRGIEILRAAGVDVVVGVEEEACQALNVGFTRVVTRGRPAVWLKAAATLDGRIADHQGRSRWITGPQARGEVHALRDRVDAVLVGSGTLLADDPALTTRGVEGGRDPLPVLLDGGLRVPAAARVLGGMRRPVVYCRADAPARELPADVVRLHAHGHLPLPEVLADLARRGVNHLLVEGGATIHRAFLDAGVVDRVLLYLAPHLLAAGPSWVGGPPWDLGAGPRLRVDTVSTVGEDLCVQLVPDR